MSEHQHHGGVDLINRKVINECYRLNNIASMSISDGNYEEAIALLTKGLKQSLSFDCCTCYSLQSCFLIREEREEQEEEEEDYSMDCYSSIDKNDDDCYGFVYRKALRVNMSSSIEQQMHYYTGSTLRVIIVFNLALAYHLKAIATTIITATATAAAPTSTSSTTTTTKLLQQSLHLYMLAYRLHTEYEEQQQQQQQEQEQESSSTTSTSLFNSDNLGNLRFVMIISNNIGEIHRISNDTTKHVRCLEHVLSCIMHTVVNFNNCSSNSSSISSNRNHQNHGHGNDYLHYSSFDLNGFHHNLSGKYQYAPAA